MAAKGESSVRLDLRLVDWRARHIDDPVKRLRFLQRVMGSDGGAPRRRARTSLIGVVTLAALSLLPTRQVADVSRSAAFPAFSAADRTLPRIWVSERRADYELYSNGLRIETRFSVAGTARRYLAFPRPGGKRARAAWRREPAGIVFHASEGGVAPFEPEQNGTLHRQGQALLAYVSGHGLYHFVIDRFGRVHRVVEESAPAAHAGHSIWADAEWVYLGLNQSFLALCFEGHGRDGGLTAAQIHAGKVLTEMLRARYGIPASNCVGHAQVSVNPANYRVGYHTDWAAGLPFAELALPDNPRQPLPSLLFFGFEADSSYVEQAGAGLRVGVALSEEMIRRAAAAQQVSVRRYRADLRHSYQQWIAALR